MDCNNVEGWVLLFHFFYRDFSTILRLNIVSDWSLEDAKVSREESYNNTNLWTKIDCERRLSATRQMGQSDGFFVPNNNVNANRNGPLWNRKVIFQLWIVMDSSELHERKRSGGNPQNALDRKIIFKKQKEKCHIT